MNTLKRIAAVAAFVVVALPLVGSAQAQVRIGYTDTELLLVQMPDYQAAQRQFQQFVEQKQPEVEALDRQFSEKLADYQSQQAMLAPDARQRREEELMGLQRQRQQMMQTMQSEEAKLIEPVLQKLQGAVDKVARAKNLTVVLSSRVNGDPVLLYVSDAAVDITQDIMSELGIRVSQR
jgi:outer membrane protein